LEILPIFVPSTFTLFGDAVNMVLGWVMIQGKSFEMFASFLSELKLTIIFISNQSTPRDRYEPTLLDTHAGGDHKLEWVHIECGLLLTVGLTKNGEVFTWGYTYYGQLGHGDEKHRTIPTKVESLDGLVITKISCGTWHTAAITDKGELYTWYVRS
jgi:hypothetical protein